MTLTAADVAEIMKLVEQSSFDELTLEIDGVKLSLRRGGAIADGAKTGVVASTHATESRGAASAGRPQSPGGSDATTASAAATPPDPNVHDVPSPLLGTFYRAPKPGAPPFIEVGEQVNENTVVAIIEVMKLMNTVRAGVRGTVTEILLPDGALAEYAQPLMRVRKEG